MSLNRPDLGFMNLLSNNVERVERDNQEAIPDIRRGDVLFIASDYSGEHDLAEYQSLSFLFADLERCSTWEEMRTQLRQRHLSDGRRIAFKNLRDKKSRGVLNSFLDAANTIPGLSLTVLIHKDIESLFRTTGRIDRTEPELQNYLHWPETSFEKMLRVVHIIGLFLAGLSRSGQDVIWFTDEDEIAANDDRLRELTAITMNITSHYLPHDLRHLRCGTTKSDNGTRQIEDLVSIPDLIAGALSEVLMAQNAEGLVPQDSLLLFRPHRLSSKTAEIMNWFASSINPLKRLVYVIEPGRMSPSLSLRQLRFHGTNDFRM
jgi:hypothetical protein